MSRPVVPPPGFAMRREGRRIFLAAAASIETWLRWGFDQPRTWQAHLARPADAPGRGATACVELDGAAVRLKQLRRGGLTARIWRERFAGSARLLDNLRVPGVAAARGVPTAEPLALLLVEGPRGLYRGWLAVCEIPGASDLLTELARPDPPADRDLAAVLSVVRKMHDAGIEHRDLNLGNLLLVRQPGLAPAAFVIDLDAARVHAGPLAPRLRRRAFARLDRSYVKWFGTPSPVRGRWCDLYAAGDPTLRSSLGAPA